MTKGIIPTKEYLVELNIEFGKLCKANKLEPIKFLVEGNKDLLDNDALCSAISYGVDLEIVKCLIEVLNIDLTSLEGSEALGVAVVNERHEIASYLKAKGAGPKQSDKI